MLTIGFAGTAKNTGKTTTALHVLDLARDAGRRLALTSIGFDGENNDHITGLPKPRYSLEKGTILATAQGCLKLGTARCCLHAVTDIHTIFGPVVIAEVEAPGNVVLAGPNRKRDLQAVLCEFVRLGAELSMVDGALNRLVPLTAADGLVLSTGAALDERLPVLAAHASDLVALFLLPPAPGQTEDGPANKPQVIQIRFAGGQEACLKTGSLLSQSTLEAAATRIERRVASVTIPGACDPAILQQLLDRAGAWLEGAELVFGSPLRLAASGDPRTWSRLVQQAGRRGQRVSYLESVPLRLLTVNPFYPCYLPRLEAFEPVSVDIAALLAAVRSQVKQVPVVDIRQPHTVSILSLLEAPGREPLSP
jgi:hypothetical protein